MAVVDKNLITKGLRGQLGKTLVFRKVGDRTIVATSPSTGANPTEAQKAQRERFQQAVIFAKSQMRDSVSRALYEQEAKRRGQPNGYNVAIADFFKAPDIIGVNAGTYAGNINHLISVTVTDDVAISSVKVDIFYEDGSLAESGQAVQTDPGSLLWVFSTTQENKNFKAGKIVATAYDRPGNSAVKEMPYTF